MGQPSILANLMDGIPCQLRLKRGCDPPYEINVSFDSRDCYDPEPDTIAGKIYMRDSWPVDLSLYFVRELSEETTAQLIEQMRGLVSMYVLAFLDRFARDHIKYLPAMPQGVLVGGRDPEGVRSDLEWADAIWCALNNHIEKERASLVARATN